VLAQALSTALGRLVRAPPALTLSSTEAVRAAVQAGAGPAVLSKYAVHDHLARGAMVRVPVEGLDFRRELRAVWPGDRACLSPPARDLLGCILQTPLPDRTAAVSTLQAAPMASAGDA
jgi:DNA-binding transcriptional LysR family regulator